MPTSLASILPKPTSATLQTPVSVSRMLGLCREKGRIGCRPNLLQRGPEWHSTWAGCKLQEDGDSTALAGLPAGCMKAPAASRGDVQHGNSEGVHQMLEQSSCTDSRCTAWPCQVHGVSSCKEGTCTDIDDIIFWRQ